MQEPSIILVINSGSSSLKLTLFEVLPKRGLKRILDSHLKGVDDQETALKKELDSWIQLGFSISRLVAIGHRVVHGGGKYFSCTPITPKVLAELKQLSELAPLHNPASVEGIQNAQKYFHKIPQFAVFDTAFHHGIPPYASQYAIPHVLAKKYPIKRYGFHGISHAYLFSAYAKKLKKAVSDSKVITLHLGSGCSMCAIKGGVSIDTTMGFTPLEGLVMSTRTGDIDPAVLEYLCLHEKNTPSDVIKLFNDHSGLLGLSGKTADMRALLKLSKTGSKAQLAIDMFCYRILKYIGAYAAVLGGLDALIFSGGIGENSYLIRQKIISDLKWMEISLDKQENRKAVHLKPGDIHAIHSGSSLIKIYAIGTDENGFIANEILSYLKNNHRPTERL